MMERDDDSRKVIPLQTENIIIRWSIRERRKELLRLKKGRG